MLKWLKNLTIFKSSKQKITQKNDSVEHARSIGVQVGKDCRLYIRDFGSEPYLISIGDHVTITKGVNFITHDGGMWVLRNEYPDIDYIRPIIIHDNCFIGMNAILLPGITIGPNSIIGAGAVVTKSIPPNSIAVGVPAKVISTMAEFKRHLPETLPTASLTSIEKRAFYLQYFGNLPEDWIKWMEDNK